MKALLAFVALTLCAAGVASADIYSFVDKNGVTVFTNVPPPGGARMHVKVLYKTGPGKASSLSGASSVEGCKASRADVVPSRDKAPERYHRYDDYIAEASALYAIPTALIRAVIRVESDYDPRVVSCAGAKGLMQIMPYEEVSQKIEHVFDPRENILAGTRLLRINANRFAGDLVKTIASYHAGVGAVSKYNGIPPYQTTQDYVRMVHTHYQKYKSG